MRKDNLIVHVFQNRNWFSPKSDWWFFFKLWLSEDLSIGTILSEKKYRGTGLLPQKTEALQAEYNAINHDYRAAMLKKYSAWLLPFYMAVAT